MKNVVIIFLFLSAFFFMHSCKYDKIDLNNISGENGAVYPEDVQKIFIGKCAVSGCHTTNDKDVAGGLNLSSWDALFQGARNGSPVVPYSAKFSFLTYFINSYPELGITNVQVGNTMPPSPPALTHDEVVTIINWINSGAPDRNGNVKFADDAFRKKIYVSNQGCDEVAVIDAASRQIMRYVHVGADTAIESPHQIRVSQDRKDWYVVFANNGKYLQRYNAMNDSYVGQVFIGNGSWNTLALTPDGKHAFAADWKAEFPAPGGKVVHVNLETMTLTSQSTIPIDFPHATYYMHSDSALYVSAEFQSRLYRFSFHGDPDFTFQVNDPPDVITLPAGDQAHDIIFTPDESKYFVTCGGTNMVRVFQSSNDSLIASIPVGRQPRELAVSQTHPYVFVTCELDSLNSNLANPQDLGSVFVINYNTNALVPVASNMDLLYYQPHGIAVDDVNGIVYVASRNVNASGPPPHHTTDCGRTGWVTVIDMNAVPLRALSFDSPLIGTYYYKYEVLSDPYSVVTR